MARANIAQFNIRSRFARERATEIARATGMTTAQVVEDALRAYVPCVEAEPGEGLVRVGRMLVLTGGGPYSLEEAEADLEAARNRELFYDED